MVRFNGSLSGIRWSSLIDKKEPVVQRKEQIPDKKEPVVQKQEPVVQKQEPVVQKQEQVPEKKGAVVQKKEQVPEKKEPGILEAIADPAKPAKEETESKQTEKSPPFKLRQLSDSDEYLKEEFLVSGYKPGAIVGLYDNHGYPPAFVRDRKWEYFQGTPRARIVDGKQYYGVRVMPRRHVPEDLLWKYFRVMPPSQIDDEQWIKIDALPLLRLKILEGEHAGETLMVLGNQINGGPDLAKVFAQQPDVARFFPPRPLLGPEIEQGPPRR